MSQGRALSAARLALDGGCFDAGEAKNDTIDTVPFHLHHRADRREFVDLGQLAGPLPPRAGKPRSAKPGAIAGSHARREIWAASRRKGSAKFRLPWRVPVK
jgi:hypothetical protein